MAGESKPTIKITVDGAEKEVALPDGVLLESDVRARFTENAVVAQQKADFEKEIRGKLPAELMNNEEYIERLVRVKGETLRQRLGIKKGDEPDKDKLLEQFRDQELKPLTEQLSAKDVRINELLERQQQNEAKVACVDGGIRDELLDLVQPWVAAQMKWSDEHKAYVVIENGEVQYKVGENGRTVPKTALDLLADVEKSGKKKDWFKARVRDGANYQGSRGSRTVSLDDFEKMSPADRSKLHKDEPELYRQLMQAREEKGNAALRR